MKTKKEIRLEMLATLKQLPTEKRQDYNEQIVSMLTRSSEWNEAQVIAVTLSRFPEVDTDLIIKAAFTAQKKIVIPYSGKGRKLSFYYFDQEAELEESSFGILEPKNREVVVPKENIHLIIVPGLAYSTSGYRVGFGGGYYDRYLADYQGMTASILYPFQLSDHVNDVVENFDIPVHKLFIPAK